MARKRATDLSKTDMTMLVLIVLLVIFGLAVLFSSSEYNGRVRFGDSACYFKKQLFATALGMGVMYMVSSIDYHFFLRLGPVAYLISMFLSGAVLFVGQEINGSKRWLNLGPLSFQPSEFAKVAVILFLAWQIERTKKATMGFGFMCRTILTLLPIIGLVGSNNLSTAIIIMGIGGILIFVSNPGYLEFIGLGSAGAGFIAVFLAAESYRLERLAIWRNPEKYEKGFQTIQGLYAIGSSRSYLSDFSVCNASVAAGCGCHACKRSGRSSYLLWNYGASGSSGYFEYCSGDQYNPQYRHYAAFYQLWRNFGSVSSWGNGTCDECWEM